MIKKIISGLSIGALILLSGCATKQTEVLKPSKKIMKKLEANQNIIPGFKKVKVHKFISMSDGKTLKQTIEELNKIWGTNYFYDGEDIILPKSNFKIYTPKDLAYYVRTTTKYNLIIKPDYNKHQIIKVYLLPKKIKNENYQYIAIGKTHFLDEIFKLQNSGIQVIVNKDVPNREIVLSINTKNPYLFLNAVCQAANVWCDLNSNGQLIVRATKLLTINLDKDGGLTYALKEGSAGGTGGQNGGDNTENQVINGISYKVNDISYKDLVKYITSNIDADSLVSDNGVIQFNATPNQYKQLKEFFEKRKNRKQLVNVNIRIYRVDLNDQFQWGVNWDTITKFLFKGVNGLKLTSNYQAFEPTTTGGILQFKDKFLTRNINQYIQEHKKELKLSDIQELRNSEYSGFVQALEQFGKVYSIDSYSNQFYTGYYIPFGNYQTVKYYNIGSTGGDNPEPITELNQENVGFQGSIIVNKNNNGYDVNGIIKLSAITSYTQLTTKYGTLKAPNTTAKVFRIKTHLSSLNRAIILGGFITRGLDKKEAFTPGVGNIPMFGYFFKNKNDLTKNSEFIILIDLRKPFEGKLK